MATLQEKIKRVLDSRPSHVFTTGEVQEKLDIEYSPSGELRKMVEKGTAKLISLGHYQSINCINSSKQPSEKGEISYKVTTEVGLSSDSEGVYLKENGVIRFLKWSVLLKLAEQYGEIFAQEC